MLNKFLLKYFKTQEDKEALIVIEIIGLIFILNAVISQSSIYLYYKEFISWDIMRYILILIAIVLNYFIIYSGIKEFKGLENVAG